MLILSRSRGECVIIGEGEDQVVVTVVDILGGKVRIGFDAHRSIAIHREEIYKAIKSEQGLNLPHPYQQGDNCANSK